MSWTCTTVAPNSHIIEWQTTSRSGEFWALLRSDAHHDNTYADWSLERQHLDEARERGAVVIDGGDLFCAMQGKYDKRSDVRQCRAEHQQGQYLDALVATAADFYEPFAKQFALLGPGNHETSILKRHETCLTTRLAERLNERTGSSIAVGAYAGFVTFRVRRQSTTAAVRMFRHHGYGGGGPVTKDTIQAQRMAAVQADADVIWSGHVHQQWSMMHERFRCTRDGHVYLETQWHLKTAGYKDEASPMTGWHTERGGPPKPRGAIWLRFTLSRDRGLVVEPRYAT